MTISKARFPYLYTFCRGGIKETPYALSREGGFQLVIFPGNAVSPLFDSMTKLEKWMKQNRVALLDTGAEGR